MLISYLYSGHLFQDFEQRGVVLTPVAGGAGHLVKLAGEGCDGEGGVIFGSQVQSQAQVFVQEIGHKARLEAAVEGAQGELRRKLPARARADADNFRHGFNVGARFDAEHERFGYRRRDCADEAVIDKLDNLARALWADMEDILRLAHSLQYRACLLEWLFCPPNHNGQSTVDRAL